MTNSTLALTTARRGKPALNGARFPLVAWALAIGVVACAHSPKIGEAAPIDPSPHEVVPDDWMVVKLQKGGQQQVVNRQQYAELKSKGVKIVRGGSLEKKPPMLLGTVAPIRLHVAQVKTFMFEDAAIDHVVIAGGNAEAYWTRPYLIHRREANGTITEHKGSDLHLQGLGEGISTLEVEFSDGQPKRIIQLEVGASKKPIG